MRLGNIVFIVVVVASVGCLALTTIIGAADDTRPPAYGTPPRALGDFHICQYGIEPLDVIVDAPAPPAPLEESPAIVTVRYPWVSGYWDYNGTRFYWHPGCLNLSPVFAFQRPVYERTGRGLRFIRPYWKDLQDPNAVLPSLAAINTGPSEIGPIATSGDSSAPLSVNDTIIVGCRDLNAHEVYRDGDFERCDCNEGYAKNAAGTCERPHSDGGVSSPTPVPPMPGPLGPLGPRENGPTRAERVKACKDKAERDANACTTSAFKGCTARNFDIVKNYCHYVNRPVINGNRDVGVFDYTRYWWACSVTDARTGRCDEEILKVKAVDKTALCVDDAVTGEGDWSSIKANVKLSYPIPGGGSIEIGGEASGAKGKLGIGDLCLASTRELAGPRCDDQRRQDEAKCDAIP
jgi:hypothetical protein